MTYEHGQRVWLRIEGYINSWNWPLVLPSFTTRPTTTSTSPTQPTTNQTTYTQCLTSYVYLHLQLGLPGPSFSHVGVWSSGLSELGGTWWINQVKQRIAADPSRAANLSVTRLLRPSSPTRRSPTSSRPLTPSRVPSTRPPLPSSPSRRSRPPRRSVTPVSILYPLPFLLLWWCDVVATMDAGDTPWYSADVAVTGDNTNRDAA